MSKARALPVLPPRDGGATFSSGQRKGRWRPATGDGVVAASLCQGQQQRAGTKEDPQELKLKNLFIVDF